jgi:regulator of protease activity HflC (stomatin/prohibitin superfamily)
MNISAYSSLPPPDVRNRRAWWTFLERRLPMLVIYLMVITLIGAIIAPQIVVTVPSGHVGLLWKRFRGGTALNPRLLKDEGLRLILPWDRLFLYDLRMQSTTDSYNAITKDGVNITANINIRFRLKHDAIPQLHQAIGPEYISLLVRPEIGSRMREVIAEYTAEEVYSTKRQEIQNRILGRTESMMSQKMVQRSADQSEYGDAYDIPLDALLNLVDTLVLGIELPPSVVSAINRKVEQYYVVQEYQFRVERERKESERKKIEAEGIRDFQQIVSQGISDSYVRWRGIEATLQLAQSTNAKVVIIGNAKDGLPIILGNADSSAPAPIQTPAQQPAHAPDTNSAASTPTSAPQPALPLERTPAANLSTPQEKLSPSDKSGQSTKATPSKQPQGGDSGGSGFQLPSALSIERWLPKSSSGP